MDHVIAGQIQDERRAEIKISELHLIGFFALAYNFFTIINLATDFWFPAKIMNGLSFLHMDTLGLLFYTFVLFSFPIAAMVSVGAGLLLARRKIDRAFASLIIILPVITGIWMLFTQFS